MGQLNHFTVVEFRPLGSDRRALVQGRRNDFWVGGLNSLYRFLGGLNRLFREFLLEENDLLGELFKSWGG